MQGAYLALEWKLENLTTPTTPGSTQRMETGWNTVESQKCRWPRTQWMSALPPAYQGMLQCLELQSGNLRASLHHNQHLTASLIPHYCFYHGSKDSLPPSEAWLQRVPLRCWRSLRSPPTHGNWTYTYIYMYIYIYVYMYVYMHVHMHMYMYGGLSTYSWLS